MSLMSNLMKNKLAKAVFDNGIESVDDILGRERSVREDADTAILRMDDVLRDVTETDAMEYFNCYAGNAYAF